MRTLSAPSLPTCILAFCFASAFAQSAPKPTLSPDPLPEQQITIYRLFLADYNHGSKANLNISQTTRGFEPEEGDLAGRMKGFSKGNLPRDRRPYILSECVSDRYSSPGRSRKT